MSRYFLFSLFSLFSFSLGAIQGDTLVVTFDKGGAQVDEATARFVRQRIAMWRRAIAAGVILSPSSSFRVESSCSPEGFISFNNRLAQGRAHAVWQLLDAPAASGGIIVHRQPDWRLLLRRIQGDAQLPARVQALSLIGDLALRAPSEAESAARLADLRRLASGQAWRYLEARHFPAMRRGLLVMPTSFRKLPLAGHLTAILPARLPAPPDTLLALAPISPRVPKKPFYMALKTNLLFDAMLLPNVGVELALGRRWSVAGNWAYNWLHTDARHYYWRIYGGDVEIHRWLGHRAAIKPLTGHHVGIYSGLVTYDIEFGGRGYLGDRWSYFGGLSYGYSHPIGDRLNLDCTLGLGYLGGTFKEYLPDEDCYVWQSTKKRRYIGPTKLEVSLVWLIGRGNRNGRKGGAR